MWQTINKTFKEIDNRHTMICIDDVEAIKICELNNRKRVNFYTNNNIYLSKEFAEANKSIISMCGGNFSNKRKE